MVSASAVEGWVHLAEGCGKVGRGIHSSDFPFTIKSNFCSRQPKVEVDFFFSFNHHSPLCSMIKSISGSHLENSHGVLYVLCTPWLLGVSGGQHPLPAWWEAGASALKTERGIQITALLFAFLPRRFAGSWNALGLISKVWGSALPAQVSSGMVSWAGESLALSARFVMFVLMLLTGAGMAQEKCASKRIRAISHVMCFSWAWLPPPYSQVSHTWCGISLWMGSGGRDSAWGSLKELGHASVGTVSGFSSKP